MCAVCAGFVDEVGLGLIFPAAGEQRGRVENNAVIGSLLRVIILICFVCFFLLLIFFHCYLLI